jgi:hypothetical protein
VEIFVRDLVLRLIARGLANRHMAGATLVAMENALF